MGKGNRETVRERGDTVEEDLALGPIVQEVIFSHFFRCGCTCGFRSR